MIEGGFDDALDDVSCEVSFDAISSAELMVANMLALVYDCYVSVYDRLKGCSSALVARYFQRRHPNTRARLNLIHDTGPSHELLQSYSCLLAKEFSTTVLGTEGGDLVGPKGWGGEVNLLCCSSDIMLAPANSRLNLDGNLTPGCEHTISSDELVKTLKNSNVSGVVKLAVEALEWRPRQCTSQVWELQSRATRRPLHLTSK